MTQRKVRLESRMVKGRCEYVGEGDDLAKKLVLRPLNWLDT